MKKYLHKTKKHTGALRVVSCFVFLFALLLPAIPASAQNSMSFTVTPPLFQLTIAPGEEWKSSVKVVNSNPYEMPVYASVMNFEAKGDAGHGEFIPIIDDDIEFEGQTLGDWIQVSPEPTYIIQGQSVEIPFSVRIPEGAQPGGHYAAILLGNKPLESEGTVMKISSYVSALVFVNVEGDVVESGHIREFSTAKSFYETPDTLFTLRFENTGNVHVQPQGHIIITNMWGKERGRIPINNKTDYGNVLPGSIRKFEFDWSGEANFFEVGRYKAIATVVYGTDQRQNDHWISYFWVIPVKPALYVFGSFFLFMFFIIWSIKRYVRRAVDMEKRYMYNTGQQQSVSQQQVTQPARRTPEFKTLARPLVVGAVDLRSTVGSSSAAVKGDTTTTLVQFAKKYHLFLIFVIVVGIAIFAASMYFGEVLTPERNYEYEVIE